LQACTDVCGRRSLLASFRSVDSPLNIASASMLAVLTRSNSFSAIWPDIASASGLPLHEVQSCDEVRQLEGSCAVLISVAGEEQTAPALVRGLARPAGPQIAVVGAEPCHRLCAEVLQEGASNYFSLPQDLGDLHSWVAERAETAAALAQAAALETEARASHDFSKMIGRSPTLRATLQRASRIIPGGTTTALITGETGTGKQLLAEAIHYNGPRADRPFVDINCAALPANLLEAELFGHEKGAFTDAKAARPGLFEAADGGTVFLDEIGDLPLEVQGKLLKVLDTKRVRRVGSVTAVPVDTRVLAGTHMDLQQRVREGHFRQDLYYRLNVIPLVLPPLRARGTDVLLLAEHFAESISEAHDVPRPELTPDVRKILLSYPWPGNVRELRNSMERAILLGDGTLDPTDLLHDEQVATKSPQYKDGDGAGYLPFPASMEEIQRVAARTAVHECGGNKSRAAQILNISRKRLYTLLHPRSSSADHS